MADREENRGFDLDLFDDFDDDYFVIEGTGDDSHLAPPIDNNVPVTPQVDKDFSLLDDVDDSDDVDELVPEKKVVSEHSEDMIRDYDIGFDQLLVEEDKTDEEIELDNILDRQRLDNMRSYSGHTSAPSGVFMVNEAVAESSSIPEGATDPGDNKGMKLLAGLTATILVIIIAGLAYQIWYHPEPNTSDIRTHGQTTLGPGTVIDTENQEEDSEPVRGREEETVRVPEGGSLVDYSIITEGDINSVSTAYITAAGSQESETGLTEFPWNKSLGMRASINPEIAVNSSGYGTITCTITSDGEKVSEKTSSGENPSVECIL